MMKNLVLFLVVIMATGGVHAADAIAALPLEKEVSTTIVSLEQVDQIAQSTQQQFWQLVPPATDDPFYLHSEPIVRAVDWNSKSWPSAVLKQMYAEMGVAGASRPLYPFYRITIVETRTGDRIYYNSYDQEVWRTPAPIDYNPYLFAFQSYGVESEEELSFQQKLFGRSSNVGTSILLLPEVFMDSYLDDVAIEAQVARLAALSAAPLKEEETVSVAIALTPVETTTATLDAGEMLMMTMVSSPPTPPIGGGGGGGGGSSSNRAVELTISLPVGFGTMGHIEIFTKDELVYSTNWAQGDSWIPTHGIDTVHWTDPESTNKMQRFYLVSEAADSDGDGHSDLYEAWVGNTQSNVFDEMNTDADDLHDWWETKLFGGLSQTGTNDFDADGLLNNEEIVLLGGRVVRMDSDPALADSDADGLDDFEERRTWNTDAMDPDTDDDGRDDASEVLGSPPSDPHNPDTVVPIVTFIGN